MLAAGAWACPQDLWWRSLLAVGVAWPADRHAASAVHRLPLKPVTVGSGARAAGRVASRGEMGGRRRARGITAAAPGPAQCLRRILARGASGSWSPLLHVAANLWTRSSLAGIHPAYTGGRGAWQGYTLRILGEGGGASGWETCRGSAVRQGESGCVAAWAGRCGRKSREQSTATARVARAQALHGTLRAGILQAALAGGGEARAHRCLWAGGVMAQARCPGEWG